MKRICREDQITDNQTGNIAPRYAAQVEAQTLHRERLYRRAQRALEAAERRHARAIRLRAELCDVEKAWAAVEERVRELRALEALMTEVPGARRPRHARHVAGGVA